MHITKNTRKWEASKRLQGLQEAESLNITKRSHILHVYTSNEKVMDRPNWLLERSWVSPY